jgi:hypothetical protein
VQLSYKHFIQGSWRYTDIMSTIHCNTPSTKFSRLISGAKSNDELICAVFKFIKNCHKLKPHCPLPQEVWIFKSIKNKTCYDCVLFYISIPVYWANTRNSSCLTPNIWQTFYKRYSSQKSKYIIKLPYIFISSKYLNLQGKASEHSKVIIIQFYGPLLYGISLCTDSDQPEL